MTDTLRKWRGQIYLKQSSSSLQHWRNDTTLVQIIQNKKTKTIWGIAVIDNHSLGGKEVYQYNIITNNKISWKELNSSDEYKTEKQPTKAQIGVGRCIYPQNNKQNIK